MQAMLYLGNMYYAGRGTRTEPEKAAEWYKRAAEQGNASAAFHYGYCLEKGIGAEKNAAEALVWYERAADGGVAGAAYNLALLTELGAACQKNPARAAELYEKAYSLGSKDAAKKLSEFYRRGVGVKRDRRAAADWAVKAGESPKTGPGGLKEWKARQKPNIFLFWFFRVFGAAFVALAGIAAIDGLSEYPIDTDDLEGSFYFLLLAAAWYFFCWIFEPSDRKHAPRALHGVIGAILAGCPDRGGAACPHGAGLLESLSKKEIKADNKKRRIRIDTNASLF